MHLANSHQFIQHWNWYQQAIKDLKDFFFVAHDMEEDETYPQFFEEQIEMEFEMNKLLAQNLIKVIAVYRVIDEFENQYYHQIA